MILRRAVLPIFFWISVTSAFSIDSLFEPLIRPFDLLPEYYLRFDFSTFALHRDAFFKRQYWAEPHPDLEFCFLSYKDLIASVWQVDFQFGLGKVQGDNVFTVLSVAFGITPTIELRLRNLLLAGGVAHRCFHNIDRTEFPVAYYNKLFLMVAAPNYRLNSFWKSLADSTQLTYRNRFAWQVSAGYFLKKFFGIVEPVVVTAYDPSVWEASTTARFAFYKRTSWVFSLRGETNAGIFNPQEGYHVWTHRKVYWKQGLGVEAFFTRGSRGGCLYALYHLDDLPIANDQPAFSLGHARFSKNGLAQIGVVFFN